MAVAERAECAHSSVVVCRNFICKYYIVIDCIDRKELYDYELHNSISL